MADHPLSLTTAQIVREGVVLLPQRCPVCALETYALVGSLCEQCYPEAGSEMPQAERQDEQR